MKVMGTEPWVRGMLAPLTPATSAATRAEVEENFILNGWFVRRWVAFGWSCTGEVVVKMLDVDLKMRIEAAVTGVYIDISRQAAGRNCRTTQPSLEAALKLPQCYYFQNTSQIRSHPWIE